MAEKVADFYPKVSIVIPVYNGSDYLREAIDSALAQTYANIEVLVVNDGSTDGGKTDEIARAYGDRIRYFSKDNGGVSTALNVGIKEMTGDFFAWLSHDDVYFPEKIERQIQYLRWNPDAKLVTSNFVFIDKHSNLIGEYANCTLPIIKTGRDVLSVWTYGCCILIHKDCFNKAGLWNEKNRTTQDDEMWLKLVKHYPIYFMQDRLCKSRKHAEQGTIRLAKQHLRDKYEYFRWILQEFDICWFFPSDSMDSALLRSQTYIWIGDYAGRVGSFDGARLCYKYAIKAYPFSRDGYRKYFFNMMNIQRLITCKNKLVKKLQLAQAGKCDEIH
jgi:glycosyltransferase involved in cell wall biosynthesis